MKWILIIMLPFIFMLWCCLVLASEDDDREGRG